MGSVSVTSRASQLALPIGVVGVVLLLVVPLPAALLDLLIAFNITAAIAILLVSIYIKRPLDFAVFPSLILVLTLLRLSLNVSATRLVLRDGYAGKVIDSFGHFVVGGSLVIGLVIFLILVVIQFAVITNGAGRVAEVGARFTLDAMPGKQMAIDADLNSGLIDEDEARKRRADVSAEADFYGAMDGGSKFVKGDAVAAIVITIINLVGGFAIGMLQRGLSPAEALQTYSLLTIGDGLVSQIPALLLSVATGLIVTRSTTNGDMGSDAAAQIGAQPRALYIAGAAAIGIGLLPGIPKLPFMLIGAAVLLVAQRTSSRASSQLAAELTSAAADEPATQDTPDALMGEMRVDPLEVVLAPDLVDLVDSGVGGDLLDRVRALRRKIALQLGLVMPPVRTRDSLDLPPSGYSIRISGVEVGRGQAPPGHVLAIGEGLDNIPGRVTTEPVFGLAGKWVPVEARQQAELYGALGRRPVQRADHPPGRDRADPCGPADGSRGRQGADRVRPAHPPRGRRGAHPGADDHRRGAARPAGPARRGRLGPRPGPGVRGAESAGEDRRRRRRAGRGIEARARPRHLRRLGPRRRPPGDDPGAHAGAAAGRGRPAERERHGPRAARRRRRAPRRRRAERTRRGRAQRLGSRCSSARPSSGPHCAGCSRRTCRDCRCCPTPRSTPR